MKYRMLEVLKNAIAKGDKTSFMKDGEKLYVHFDEITIRAAEVPSGRLFNGRKYSRDRYVIEFHLNGGILKEIALKEPVFLGSGDTITLTQIEGVFELEITI